MGEENHKVYGKISPLLIGLGCHVTGWGGTFPLSYWLHKAWRDAAAHCMLPLPWSKWQMHFLEIKFNILGSFKLKMGHFRDFNSKRNDSFYMCFDHLQVKVYRMLQYFHMCMGVGGGTKIAANQFYDNFTHYKISARRYK